MFMIGSRAMSGYSGSWSEITSVPVWSSEDKHYQKLDVDLPPPGEPKFSLLYRAYCPVDRPGLRLRTNYEVILSKVSATLTRYDVRVGDALREISMTGRGKCPPRRRL